MNPVTAYDPTTSSLRRWWALVLLGAGLALIGVVLLIDIAGAAFSLAILVGLGLLLAGFDEFAQADRHAVRWPSYVLGTIWILTGLWAVAWPGVTLLVLAWVVGLGLLVGGATAIVFGLRFRRELPLWGIWLLDGVFGIVAGVLALLWPGATVLVLAILFGVRILLRGLATISFGLALRRLHRDLGVTPT